MSTNNKAEIKKAEIGQPAPQPLIECWAQGQEPPIKELTGQVILIEVIQVNCPGCFLHALPEVIELHQRYQTAGLKVFVIATAFEHFEHNTLKNLERLLINGEVQGDPLIQLGKAGFLEKDRLPYDIPFSVAMDKLQKNDREHTVADVDRFILSQIPDFYQNGWSDERRHVIIDQAEAYLQNKVYSALTFEMYQLQGTPSTILIDRKGLLRQVSFGTVSHLKNDIQALLNEP